MGTRHTRGLVALSAALVAAAVAYGGVAAFAGSSKSSVSNFARGHALGAQAFYEHGRIRLPGAIVATTDQLNAALDSCYLGHGATRVPLSQGGWTYNDPNGVAQSACQSQQAAVDGFANGSEMAGFSQAVQPLARDYWACMVGAGAVPPNVVGADVDVSSSAFKSTADSCSAKANATAAVAGG
jgi:hypothetical protein